MMLRARFALEVLTHLRNAAQSVAWLALDTVSSKTTIMALFGTLWHCLASFSTVSVPECARVRPTAIEGQAASYIVSDTRQITSRFDYDFVSRVGWQNSD